MNAPWSPGRAGAGERDPFTAYVCDDNTADVIRPICIEMGWPVEKIHKGGLRNAVQSLSVAASPIILFVDLAESGDPLNDINALAEVCEPGTVVIAAGEVNDVRLYRDLVASGIQDYLLKPLTADHLRDAFANAQALLSAPKHVDGAADTPRISGAVIGARGGVGASMITSSIAWLNSDRAQRSTALLDLDVHFGTGALALDLEPGRGLTDAIENPGRIDGLFIERAMVRVNDKFCVLSSEAPINQPLLTDGNAFYQLQEELRNSFECTVIDLPRNMLVQHPHLINDVNVAIIVTELTLAGARDMIRLLAWMKSNAPQTVVTVVANKSGPNGAQEISQKDYEEAIERPIDHVIPMDIKIIGQAAKVGKTVAELAKDSPMGKALQDIALRLLPEGDEKALELAKSAKSKGGGWKSMMPKKKEKEKAPAA